MNTFKYSDLSLAKESIIFSENEKMKLIAHKKELQSQLGEIKNKIRGNGKHLPTSEYQALTKKQLNINKDMNKLVTTYLLDHATLKKKLSAVIDI